MIRGTAYSAKDPTHPYLDFVGYLDPECNRVVRCSVILVAPMYIVTALHCFSQCSGLTVRFPNGEINEISDYRAIKGCDAAICRLKNPVTNIHPITRSERPLIKGNDVIVAGWGWETKAPSPIPRLKWDILPVTNISWDHTIHMLCDKLVSNICYGDSGGAIISCNSGLMELAGVIVKSNNQGTGLWVAGSSIPNDSEPLKLSEAQFAKIVKANDQRGEIQGLLETTDSPSFDQAVDEWIKRLDNGEM